MERTIEIALRPGEFISYRGAWDFIEGMQQAKEQVDKLTKAGQPERGAGLHETFIAGCYEKAEEVDDSGGDLGMFVESLFCAWIQARQLAKADPHETAQRLFTWMDKDDYGFCHGLEQSAVKVFNAAGLSAFERVVRDKFDSRVAQGEGKKPGRPDARASHSLHRASEVLRAIYAAQGDVEAYVGVCNQVGLTPKDCESIAEIFQKHRRPTDALIWVERGLDLEGKKMWPNQSTYRLPTMKRELLAKLGRQDDALQSAWRAFQEEPAPYSYEELMKYVPKAERAEWHRKAMAEAEKGRLDALMQLCVKTKEWTRLAERVLHAQPEHLEDISHYTTEPAADGLARSHPGAAAKLCGGLGLRILKAKKSKYYGAALGHFQNAKKLYEKAGLNEEWNDLVAKVRSDHRGKHSFMPGFERFVSGKHSGGELSFLEKARRHWG
ncbi:MAG: hypothetical protein HY652_06090 [Acidobacteria bacterium]|nr:hypothetical protein [Acidobacteriota bacterium]